MITIIFGDTCIQGLCLPRLRPLGVMGSRARAKLQCHICVTGRRGESLNWDSLILAYSFHRGLPPIRIGMFPSLFQTPLVNPHQPLPAPHPSPVPPASSLSTTGSWQPQALASPASSQLPRLPTSSEVRKLPTQGQRFLVPHTASSRQGESSLSLPPAPHVCWFKPLLL